MIDFSPQHIAQLFGDLHDDSLEHFLSQEEYDAYYALDLKNEDDALSVIRRWIIPENSYWQADGVKQLIKESLRYIITSQGVVPHDCYLPGIEDTKDMDEWYVQYQKFLGLVWDELFHEPFIAADLAQYRERYDWNFVHFPHMPEIWGVPEYEPPSREIKYPPLPQAPEPSYLDHVEHLTKRALWLGWLFLRVSVVVVIVVWLFSMYCGCLVV